MYLKMGTGGMQIVSPLFQVPTAKRSGAGLEKIENSRQLATADDLDWIWIDTCCIDKTSSADLSEAINSMYRWYAKSEVCYAFLNDVEDGPSERLYNFPQMAKSKWFRRGWTLQELLAPRKVWFLDRSWRIFAEKANSVLALESITGISQSCLMYPDHIWNECIAVRLSWAANRRTSRGEDQAYSLLGLLNVNMALLYGEGSDRAFRRLMSEVTQSSNDESIFAHESSLLVPSYLHEFRGCNGILKGLPRSLYGPGCLTIATNSSVPHMNTNVGLQKRMVFITTKLGYSVAALNCHRTENTLPILKVLRSYGPLIDRSTTWFTAPSKYVEDAAVLQEAREMISQAFEEGIDPFEAETMILYYDTS